MRKCNYKYYMCVFRASKKIILPDPSVRSVMIKYLEKTGEISFDKIFHQRLGYLLFKAYCHSRYFTVLWSRSRNFLKEPEPVKSLRLQAVAV